MRRMPSPLLDDRPQYRCPACLASSGRSGSGLSKAPPGLGRAPLSSKPPGSPGSTSTGQFPRRPRRLAQRFGWHPLDLEDVLSKRQRPKVDEYDDYLFIVLHFPRYDKEI